MSRAVCTSLVVLATLSLTPVASANGRFPRASQIVIDPIDPSHIAARTTFGLVQSTDAGKTWRWVCEQSVGYTGAVDPPLAIAGDGSLLAGVPDGLSRSVDRGCLFSFASGALEGRWVSDVAVDRTAPSRVFAIASPEDPATPGFATFAALSSDHGATWTKTGASLPEDFVPLTIDVAPSNSQRVYASGNGPFRLFGYLAHSTNAGATWTQSSFDMEQADGPFIAAIDPLDEERVWLRLSRNGGDLLKISADGAKTWATAFAATGALLGFALSPDGGRVAVGGPADGLHVSPAKGAPFSRVSATPIGCLAWAPAGLYACGDDSANGFAIGLSTDEGRSFAPLLRLRDLAPLSCDGATSTALKCPDQWPAVASRFPRAEGADGGVPAASDGTPQPERPVERPAWTLEGGCALGRASVPTGLVLVLSAMLALCLRARRSRPL